MGEPHFSDSDKLAFVLFCLGAVVSIILFLVEKSTLIVTVSLLGITGLMIYPILHVAKTKRIRSLLLILLLLGVAIFGKSVRPNAPEAKLVQPQPQFQPPPQTPPKPKPTPRTITVTPPHSPSVPPVTISAPNGIAIGGGTVTNPTVNNYAPSVRVIASAQMQRETGDTAAPWETRFTISTNVLVQTGDLKLKCSGPALRAGISRINPAILITGNNGPDANDPNTVVYQLNPEILSPGRVVTIAVYSKEPVRVLSGSIGQQAITF
jgi:hypothetical protein